MEDNMANEEKHIDPVVTGDVEVNEKSSIMSDVVDIFGGLWTDILKPSLKKTIVEFISIGAERAIYRDEADDDYYYSRSGRRRDYNSISRRSSSSYRGSSNRNTRTAGSPRSRYDVNEVIFDNYADAEAVIDVLNEQLDRYDQVSIGEYYSACNLSPVSTDFNRGWYDLRDVEIVKAGRGKWTIEFPKASPLD
jgi:hypothetical protein